MCKACWVLYSLVIGHGINRICQNTPKQFILFCSIVHIDRRPEGGTPCPPPTHPYKTMFFGALRVSRIRNKMLTVKIKGLTTDLQLFSKGNLKTRVPNYRAAQILLWHLWPCNSALYVLNDLNLVSNDRWVSYLSYQHKVAAKWPPVDKLLPF